MTMRKKVPKSWTGLAADTPWFANIVRDARFTIENRAQGGRFPMVHAGDLPSKPDKEGKNQQKGRKNGHSETTSGKLW